MSLVNRIMICIKWLNKCAISIVHCYCYSHSKWRDRNKIKNTAIERIFNYRIKKLFNTFYALKRRERERRDKNTKENKLTVHHYAPWAYILILCYLSSTSPQTQLNSFHLKIKFCFRLEWKKRNIACKTSEVCKQSGVRAMNVKCLDSSQMGWERKKKTVHMRT